MFGVVGVQRDLVDDLRSVGQFVARLDGGINGICQYRVVQAAGQAVHDARVRDVQRGLGVVEHPAGIGYGLG